MSRTSFRFGDLRVVALGLVFILAWAGIGYRLFQVQGADAAVLAQRGFDQRIRHETIEAKRGTIFDRDGVELALTVYGKALIADPSLIEDPSEAAALLAPVLGSDYVELAQRLDSDERFAYVARGL
ncbi:MAG: penicillin-binding protein 2, partial [Acidimicrobiia bacterium]